MSKDVRIGVMKDVREYGEEYAVELIESTKDKDSVYDQDSIMPDEPRLCIIAYNEGHCNSTCIDLVDIIEWVKKNKPELL